MPKKKLHMREVAPEINDIASMFGRMGGEATLQAHGYSHYRELGKRSYKKRGKEAYRQMALKRWQKVDKSV